MVETLNLIILGGLLLPLYYSIREFLLYRQVVPFKAHLDPEAEQRHQELLMRFRVLEDVTNLPDISISLPNPQQFSCASFPISKEEGDDCQALCGGPNFVTLRVQEDDEVIFNGRLLDPGLYCVPGGIEPCLRKFGIRVYGNGEWLCVPTHPLLTNGPNASILVAGQNPSLPWYENRRNAFYDHEREEYVDLFDERSRPRDLASLFDEDRFSLECRGRTIDGFALVRLPGSLVCAEDYCSEVPFGASYLDISRGECVCAPNLVHEDPNDKTSPCVQTSLGYDSTNARYHFRTECFTPQTLVSRISPRDAIPCSHVGNLPNSGYSWVDIRIPDQRPSLENISSFAYAPAWRNRL